MLEDLKPRIKSLMQEIEFTHLKKNWMEQLIEAGIDQEDMHQWVAEIGHVIDEYERSLRYLVDLLQTTDVEGVAEQMDSWLAYTRDMTVWTIATSLKRLEGKYEKYLPADIEDKDDDQPL